ncbi:MAG: sulfotransferase domain-containing protein [Deltaproteobacteria bacterium]|nr:sulfotransferase domain-containing protein [Deltaproteobacteria bacterium]
MPPAAPDPRIEQVPRNLTPLGVYKLRTHTFVVSVPKSGRTWLRFFLRHYMCRASGVEFSAKPPLFDRSGLPRVEFTHDLWAHRTAPALWRRATGLYLIPRNKRRSAKILLLYRDLRDLMVSLHLQLTKRGFKSGAAFQGSVKECVADPLYGAESTVDIINHWLDEWRDTDRFMLWNYEDCRKDPEKHFRQVLEFADLGPVRDDWLRESIEFSSFDKMKKMEKQGHVNRVMLQPGDPGDPESFKVRRGVIGGFRDYLDAEDIRRIDQATARLRL